MNTDTPTPRTDAKEEVIRDAPDEYGQPGCLIGKFVSSYFARQLERELLAVTKERDEAKAEINAAFAELKKYGFSKNKPNEHLWAVIWRLDADRCRAQADLAALRAELAEANEHKDDWMGRHYAQQAECERLREALVTCETTLQHCLNMSPLDPFERGRLICETMDKARAALKGGQP